MTARTHKTRSAAQAPNSAPARPARRVRNADIAAVFEEIADILDIQDENPFRVRAYRNAARVVGGYGCDLGALLAQGQPLPKLPNIGADLAAKIDEIARTGTCELLERLRKKVPRGITALLKVPGLGPKRVGFLYRNLGIKSAAQLLEAARGGRIRGHPGFSEKLEQKLLEGAQVELERGGHMLIARAADIAERLIDALKRAPGVKQVVAAGSFRRMRETVGDLDLLAVATDARAVTERFVHYEDVEEILAQGETRCSVRLRSGLQVDLRVVDEDAAGSALQYFTGSKAHGIALRRRAQQGGLKLNEYGLFRGKRRVAGATEESVYRALGLPWIPPELREDRGEIEAAAAGRLPKLIELADLKGDLHAHTDASDGHSGLAEMAAAARAAGLEYLAITEHSPHLSVAHGLDADRLLRHAETIDRLNETLRGITLLKGVEVDILEDGRLDLPDDVLARLDLVVGAVHSAFELPRARQTRRILRALEHPCFTILAHPGGRLLGERPAMDLDMAAVIAAAKARGCFLELNAQPQRLDLSDEHCRMAKEQGVPIAIDSDAHGTAHFAHLRFGIGQARRGWLEAADVINTLPLKKLRPRLRACFRR
ncbi:MAG: DNA polymerase/3'-5' exonuclease PolX [Nevskia sp.]|nr:DNA polymerase/3'-5' exonuclease PolX [Nevskia sp.]